MRLTFDLILAVLKYWSSSREVRWNIRTSTSGKRSNTPREKAGACSKRDRALTFGDSYFVPTRVEAAASFGFSVRQETRRTMRAESVRKSMIVLTPETTATKEG